MNHLNQSLRYVSLVASGTVTDFTVPFVIWDKGDVKVYVNDLLQTQTAYEITDLGDLAGATLTFDNPPEEGAIISVVGDLPRERPVDYNEYATLRASAMNLDGNALQAQIQELARDRNRTILLSLGDSQDPNAPFSLPDAEGRRGGLLGFDGDTGAPIVVCSENSSYVKSSSTGTTGAVPVYADSTGTLLQDSGRVPGSSGGLATLDVSGKVPYAQLPEHVSGVESVVAGANISVDNGDRFNPIVSADGLVTIGTTVNGRALSSDINLTTDDIPEGQGIHRYNVQADWSANSGESAILNKPANVVVAITSGSSNLLIDNSDPLEPQISVDVSDKLDRQIDYVNGVTSEFFHESDGGGYRMVDGNDNSVSFLGGNADPQSPIKLNFYAKVAETNVGTRIIQTLQKVFYTKGNNGPTCTDENEIATILNIPTALSQLENDGNFVVDASYVHTDSNFTTEEKDKLASLDGNHFKGDFPTLEDLQATYPTASSGDYAYVGGAGEDVVNYIWDSSDSQWVIGGGGTAETPASIKEKYESNPDTNAYTNSEQETVSTIGNVSNLSTDDKTSTVAAINEVLSDLDNYVPKTTGINGHALSGNITLSNADINSEPAIAAGTESQYWRGDKTWAEFPGGGIEDLWPTNASHRFSSYAQKPYFISTGGVCAVDGWYIYNSSTTPVSSSYFASGWNMSEYALPFRKEDIVFYRMVGTAGSGVYTMNRPFTMEETAPLVGQTVTISFDIKFGEGFPLEQEGYGLNVDIVGTISTDAAVKVNTDGTFTLDSSIFATFPEITEGLNSDYKRHDFTFSIPANITMFNLRLRHAPKLNEDNSTPDNYAFYMSHFTLAIGEIPAEFKMKPLWMDVNIHTRRFLRIRSSYKGSTVQSQSYYESLAFPREMEAVPLCIRGVNEVTPVGFGSGSYTSAEEISTLGATIRRDATQTSSATKWRTIYSFVVIPWTFQNTIPNY
jgi:hypothetical protein